MDTRIAVQQAKEKVLICDDEPTIIESVRYIVSKLGFDYRVANNGDDALKMALEFRPDIILLDWNMPGLTGIEVCRELKNNPDMSDTYIILLTANAQVVERETGLASGADRYITKPFSPKGLGQVLTDTFKERQ